MAAKKFVNPVLTIDFILFLEHYIMLFRFRLNKRKFYDF